MIITDLSPEKLRRAADIQERIQQLQQELTQLLGASASENHVAKRSSGNRRRSAAWKKALSESMKARWAARKRGQGESVSLTTTKKKPTSEARLKALEKARAARWAKFRAKK